jgi:hypothetical protein
MPEWVQNLTQGWPMIKANLPTFIVLTALIVAVVWWLMDWRYGGIIANKDSEIVLLKGQRDDYREKLSGATPDQAKARIDALETRLARLEPRRLTDTQREDLASRVRLSGGTPRSIEVARDIDCTDCSALVADIAAAFGASGWQVQTPKMMGPSNPPPSGVAVRCADPAHPSAEERMVIDAMRAIGLGFDAQPNIAGGAINFGSTSRVLQILVTRQVSPK